MGNMYACGLFSVRTELKKDMWGTLRKLKRMGFDAVEFFGGFTKTAQEVRAAIDEAGLFCCGWHTPWEYLKEDALIATVTYNKVLGNENLVVPGLPGEMTNSADAWRKTAKEFEELSGRLSYYGMRLGYHNHDSEFTETEGIIPFDHFFETAPGADIQLDNGNALSSGTGYDIYAPLRRFPFRMKTTHLKPYSAKDGYATMIGQDDIDWAKYFSLCYEHQDIDWFIVEYECEEKHGQLEGVEECLKALKKMERGGMI